MALAIFRKNHKDPVKVVQFSGGSLEGFVFGRLFALIEFLKYSFTQLRILYAVSNSLILAFVVSNSSSHFFLKKGNIFTIAMSLF